MKILEVNQEQYNLTNSLLEKAKEGLDLSQFVNQRPEPKLENNIGHVWVTGMLINNATPIEKQLGCTCYKDIIEDLEDLVEDGAQAIVLHVNSGGGSCNGAVEAANAVVNCPVPVVAIIDETGCSAAYKIACGATWLMSYPSANVGNIGTILVVEDTSVLYNSMGISFEAFVGEENLLKSAGHLPSLTDDQKVFLQERINEASENFKQHVLASRPDINPEVFKSGWYSGDTALSLGLVDELGNDDLAEQRANELIYTFQPEETPLIPEVEN